jgi:hypothetical protein
MRSYAFGRRFGFWRPESAQKLNQTGAIYEYNKDEKNRSLHNISVYNWKQDCLTEIISNVRRIYDQIVQYIFINDFPPFLLTRSLRKHFDQSCKY